MGIVLRPPPSLRRIGTRGEALWRVCGVEVLAAGETGACNENLLGSPLRVRGRYGWGAPMWFGVAILIPVIVDVLDWTASYVRQPFAAGSREASTQQLIYST